MKDENMEKGAEAEQEENISEEKPAEKTTAETVSDEKKEESGKESGKKEDAPAVYDEKYVEELKAKIEQEKQAAIEEAVKQAAMTEEEKQAYEKEKHVKELEEREKALVQREIKADAKSMLAEKGMPDELLDVVIAGTMEDTKKNIEKTKAAFDIAVQKQVDLRLRGTTPSTGSGVTREFSSSLEAEVSKYFN